MEMTYYVHSAGHSPRKWEDRSVSKSRMIPHIAGDDSVVVVVDLIAQSKGSYRHSQGLHHST